MQAQPPSRSKSKIPIALIAVFVVAILVTGAWFVFNAGPRDPLSSSTESDPTQVKVVVNGSFWRGTIYTPEGSTDCHGGYNQNYSTTYSVTGSNFYVWVLVEAWSSDSGILAVSIQTMDGRLLAEGSAIGPSGLVDISWTT
jgi:hypothetical protein